MNEPLELASHHDGVATTIPHNQRPYCQLHKSNLYVNFTYKSECCWIKASTDSAHLFALNCQRMDSNACRVCICSLWLQVFLTGIPASPTVQKHVSWTDMHGWMDDNSNKITPVSFRQDHDNSPHQGTWKIFPGQIICQLFKTKVSVVCSSCILIPAEGSKYHMSFSPLQIN